MAAPACDDEPPPQQPVAPVKKGPPPFKPGKIAIFLALDSARWPINSATATALSADMIELAISQGDRGCAGAPDAAPTALLTLVREIGADFWRITKVAAKTPSVSGQTTFAILKAPVAKMLAHDADGSVNVRVDTNVPIAAGGNELRLEIHGQIPAKGCGPAAPPNGTPQKNLALSVGGETVDVESAQIAPDPDTKGYLLELATRPTPCGDLSAAEIGLTLAIDRLGRNATGAALAGLRVGAQRATDLAPGAIRINLKGAGKAIDVSLNGKASIAERFPIEIRGSVRAAMCPAPAAGGP